MRRRITFIPNDLDLKWKIVRDVKELEDQKPLSKFSLGGTHILCSKGLFYLLSMTKEKIHNLGLSESFVLKIIMENPIIEEVIQVKELGKLLLKKDECNLKMSEVLQLAVKEIETLEEQKNSLRKLKDNTEKKREYLCRKYINVLENCDIDENLKKTIYFYIRKILQNKSGKLSLYDGKSENCQCLEAIDKFLLKNIKNSEMKFHETEKNVDALINSIESRINTPSSEDLDKKEKYLNGTCFNAEESNLDNEVVRKLELKIIYLYEILNKNKLENASVQQKLTARLKMLSDHLEKIKKKSNETEKCWCPLNDVPIASPDDESKFKDSGASHSLPDVISSFAENERKLDFKTNSSIMDAIYDYSLNIDSDDISFIDINKYLYERNKLLGNSHHTENIGDECVRNFKDQNKIGKPFIKAFRLESLLKKHNKSEDSEIKNAMCVIENKELDFNKNALNKNEGEGEYFNRDLSKEHKLMISSKDNAKQPNKHLELSNILPIHDPKHQAFLEFSENNTTPRISNKYTQGKCLDSFLDEKEKCLSKFGEELDLEYEDLRCQNRLHCDEQKLIRFTPYKKFFERNEGMDFVKSFKNYITFEIPKDTPVSETVSADKLDDKASQNANFPNNGKRIILLRKRKLSGESQFFFIKKFKNN